MVPLEKLTHDFDAKALAGECSADDDIAVETGRPQTVPDGCLAEILQAAMTLS